MFNINDFSIIRGTLNGERSEFCRSEIMDGAPDGWYLHSDYHFSLPNENSVEIAIYRLTPIVNNLSDTYVFYIWIGCKFFRFRSNIQRAKKNIRLAEKEGGIEQGELMRLLCRINAWMANACGCPQEAYHAHTYITD